MSKKSLIHFQMVPSGQNLGASFETPVSGVQFTDNIGILIDWSGTAPVGTVYVDVCNDWDAQKKTGSWQTLDFGSTVAISGTSGQHTITINQLPFSFLKARYIRSSGSGSISMSISTKEIGG